MVRRWVANTVVGLSCLGTVACNTNSTGGSGNPPATAKTTAPIDTGSALYKAEPAPKLDLPPVINSDIVVPNEVEASMLTGVDVDGPRRAIDAADILLAKGASHVIVTLGSQGVLLRSPTLCLHLPPVVAGTVCDTTGAGDAFMGGLCTALAEGRTLADAAQFANAVAGISVTRPGTAASMPARSEIDRLMRRAAP